MNNQNIKSVLVEERRFDPSSEFTASARLKPEDVETLKQMGAAAVYPPGGVIAEIAQDLLNALNQKLGYAQPARKS